MKKKRRMRKTKKQQTAPHLPRSQDLLYNSFIVVEVTEDAILLSWYR